VLLPKNIKLTSQAFHAKCDGKGKTIRIIMNNLNYVFGGYASSAWHI
jgi:hypothetical protein